MNDKQIIIQLRLKKHNRASILEVCEKVGVQEILCDPKDVTTVQKKGMKAISTSDEADIILINHLDMVNSVKEKGKESAFNIKVNSNNDIQTAVEAAKHGASALVVETSDWKIIPLENLIAELHNMKTRVYTRVNNIREIRTMFSVLEKGVDGVVVTATESRDVKEASHELSSLGSVELSPVKVIEVRESGSGDRVCIDTGSILKLGEGMLIGSRSSFLFLIHNEAVGSSFTSPRPFRVNAGAVHSYLLMPDLKTKYLSEIESGDEVSITSVDGSTRSASVGRIKIENRPLALVKAEVNGEIATVLVQNAETIRFITDKGKPVSVTDLHKGDTILARVVTPKGRHFGMEVDEFILER